jgi:hypothetical protein
MPYFKRWEIFGVLESQHSICNGFFSSFDCGSRVNMWKCVSSPSELDVDLTSYRSGFSDVNPNFLRSRPCLCHSFNIRWDWHHYPPYIKIRKSYWFVGSQLTYSFCPFPVQHFICDLRYSLSIVVCLFGVVRKLVLYSDFLRKINVSYVVNVLNNTKCSVNVSLYSTYCPRYIWHENLRRTFFIVWNLEIIWQKFCD